MGRRPTAHVVERNMHRDEMARRIAGVCAKGGIKTVTAEAANAFVAENNAGTQYMVTVTHKQQQEGS